MVEKKEFEAYFSKFSSRKQPETAMKLFADTNKIETEEIAGDKTKKKHSQKIQIILENNI